MLGVVIWSCRETGKAIIWCSDHQDLAHFAGQDRIGAEVGDLVEMRLETEGSLRRCLSMQLLEPGYLPDIADVLKSGGVRTRRAA